MHRNKTFARPSRAFIISVHFFPVLDKSATWKDHFSSFNENVDTQAQIGIFFPSLDNAPLNSVPAWVVLLAFKSYTNWDNDEKNWQTWTCNFERRFCYRRVVDLKLPIDAGLRALNVVLWENLVLVVVLVLESKGPYWTILKRRKGQEIRVCVCISVLSSLTLNKFDTLTKFTSFANHEGKLESPLEERRKLNPFPFEWVLRALIDFTLSNARRFYSAMGNLLDRKGLRSLVLPLEDGW